MTKRITIGTNHSINHSTFGGIIHYSDFNTDYRGDDQKESSIAARIISDWKFDKQCEKNAKDRDRQMKYKKGEK